MFGNNKKIKKLKEKDFQSIVDSTLDNMTSNMERIFNEELEANNSSQEGINTAYLNTIYRSYEIIGNEIINTLDNMGLSNKKYDEEKDELKRFNHINSCFDFQFELYEMIVGKGRAIDLNIKILMLLDKLMESKGIDFKQFPISNIKLTKINNAEFGIGDVLCSETEIEFNNNRIVFYGQNNSGRTGAIVLGGMVGSAIYSSMQPGGALASFELNGLEIKQENVGKFTLIWIQLEKRKKLFVRFAKDNMYALYLIKKFILKANE